VETAEKLGRHRNKGGLVLWGVTSLTTDVAHRLVNTTNPISLDNVAEPSTEVAAVLRTNAMIRLSDLIGSGPE
jgi:hypothetical protein